MPLDKFEAKVGGGICAANAHEKMGRDTPNAHTVTLQSAPSPLLRSLLSCLFFTTVGAAQPALNNAPEYNAFPRVSQELITKTVGCVTLL